MKRIENYDLSTKNSFRMKVKAALYIEYDNVEELQSLDLKALPQPVFHMGAGSNLLFTKDFPGTILHSNIKYIKYVDMGLDEVLLTVGSGVVFDDLIANVAGNGLWGMENLSLIPGEVGAAAVQNIGAYGVEAKDVISGVVCLDTKDWTKTVFKVGECAYGYRDSRCKNERGRYIITSVLFRVTRKYSPKLDYGGVRAALEGRDLQALTPMDVREAIISIRNAKLPDPAQIGSAGSFFKNPVITKEHFEKFATAETPHYDLPDGTVKVPAAWLIDQCGFRGKVLGGAQVYEKQPLVIVNASGSASPEDVLTLENQIIASVQQKYEITLHPEVDHI